MISKLISFFCFFFTCVFFYLIINHYLSDEIKDQININRSTVENKLSDNKLILPILKSDTNNVIEFNSGYNNLNQNTPKRNFWDLIKIKWKKEKQLLLVF